MSDHTGIEWTDATWNPIRGCSRVSEGCRNCYAESVAARFSGPGMPYEGLATRKLRVISDEEQEVVSRWTGVVRVIEKHMEDPIRWQRPRRIFVNSMSDLFHENVSDETIERVFAVMALAPQHTFQVLTKRPKRMAEFFAYEYRWAMIEGQAQKLYHERTKEDPSMWLAVHGPLPNVWLGVSVENQVAVYDRVPLLIQTPAAVRFLSCEPLLDDVDLRGYLAKLVWKAGDSPRWLDWVIVGGESGPNARPMQPAWARRLRDQCTEAGVPFFFKQWGEWATEEDAPGAFDNNRAYTWVDDHTAMYRVGKKRAGRNLDGRTWDEFPKVAT